MLYKKLLLIDANSLIHRAFHALPPLTGPSGEPTGALYGISTMLLKALDDIKPDYAIACFDLPGPTFRHEAFEAYKAQRPKTPEDLLQQLEKSKEIIEALGIHILTAPGYEADDVIGTVVKLADNEPEIEIIILTGDRDMLQLAAKNVKIYTMRKGLSDIVIYDDKSVESHYGFKPELLPDYKALKGDQSDNIPGVPGIGEKTAASLVASFGTLEKIYSEAESSHAAKLPLTENIKQKLLLARESAFLAKKLAAISKSAPVKISLSEYEFKGMRREATKLAFQRLGFKSLIKRLQI